MSDSSAGPLDEPKSPLQFRDFRRFWATRFLTVFATLSMVVLIGYQTYDIARSDYGMDRPTAAFMLGVLGLVQFIPLMLLTPIAGAAADRFDRRKVAAFSNAIDCIVALSLGVLTWADALNLPVLFGLAACHGGSRIFGQPALSSIAPNVVPPRLLPRAIALSSIAWQIGTVIGPAAGGLLFAVWPSLPYFLSAVLLLGSAALILSIRPIRAEREGHAHPLRDILEGLSFVKRKPLLLGCVTLDLFAVMLGGATAMLPVFARDILAVGPEGLGLMRGAPAVGATFVAVWLSWRPIENNVGNKMLISVAVFGVATIAFALSRNFFVSLGFLAILGAADMISVFIRNSLVQLATPDVMRGRVSATSGLAVSASNELGEMQSGLAAAILGATGAVVFGGAGAILVTALWAWLFPELRHAKTFDLPDHMQPASQPETAP